MKTILQTPTTFQCPFNKDCTEIKDKALVEYVKTKKECYLCLMNRYEKKMLRYVKRISGVSEETAEDIVQNIFLKAYINLNGYDPRWEFSTWIYKIAHNETINHWRYTKNHGDNDISWDDNDALKSVLKDNKNVESDVYQKFTNQQLVEALEKLNEKYKIVLTLNYLEGLSYQEIAEQLERPMGTIGTLLNRGKKILKRELIKTGLSAEAALR